MKYRRKNFEYHTDDLDEHETNSLALMIEEEIKHACVEQAGYITAGALAKNIRERTKLEVKTIRVKKIVNWLLINGLLVDIIDTVRGYKRAETHAEMKRYIESLAARQQALYSLKRALNNNSAAYKHERTLL